MDSKNRNEEYNWEEHQELLPHFSEERQEMIKTSLERANKEYEELKGEGEQRFSDRNHKIFVEKCLAPQGYLKGDNEVFAYVANIETDGEFHYANISVLTPLMAYVDERYFGRYGRDYDARKVWREEYKPYYYEFIAVLNNKELENFEEDINLYKDEEGNRSWFRAKLLELNSDKCYSGTLHYGGSDSLSDGLAIGEFDVIDNEINERLNDTYEIKHKNYDLKDELDQRIYRYDNFNVKVLNVGQANCIYIESSDDRVRMFFDVGRPNKGYYSKKKKKYYPNVDLYDGTSVRKTLDSLPKYDPNIIMISHWHLDHYSAYKDLSDKAYNATWVVPDVKKKNMKSVNRLMNYLDKENANIIYVDVDGKIYDNEYGFQLWRSPDHSSKDLNRDGLVLRIHDTIFAGDSLYSYWPDELKKSVSDVARLIVPHHCCSLNSSDEVENKNVIAAFEKEKMDAYICVGDNRYGHPNADHYNELKNRKFKLHYTSKCTSDCYEFLIQSSMVYLMCDIYQCDPCPNLRPKMFQSIISGDLDKNLLKIMADVKGCIWWASLNCCKLNGYMGEKCIECNPNLYPRNTLCDFLRIEICHFLSGEKCPYSQNCIKHGKCTFRRDALRKLMRSTNKYDWLIEYGKYPCNAIYGTDNCDDSLPCKNKPSPFDSEDGSLF